MKRIISLLLLLAICLSVFVGCTNEEAKDSGKETTKPTSGNTSDDNTAEESDIPSAIAFLENQYPEASKGKVQVLSNDIDLLSVVVVGRVSYTVEWTVSVTEGSSDAAKIGESSKENHVLLDINETPETDVAFIATATVKDPAGDSKTAAFNFQIVASATAGMTDEEIVELAYQLAEGEIMNGSSTLTGVIKMIKSPWDPDFQNITVVIQIGDLADKRIECYRMTGEGAKDLAIGDTITVTGVLKNYNGTIEFDAGCVVSNIVKGETVEVPTDPKAIVDAAYALADGDALPYAATLTGVIYGINSPYDEGYQNISVTIVVDGYADKPLLVYRLKGEGADKLELGDTITVTGYIVNYKGTIEYTSGCTLDSFVKGEGAPSDIPEKEVDIVDAAYKLEEGKALPYSATLTGKVTKVDDAYSAEYGNITVTIAIAGREKKPIKCYRLKGPGVDKVAVGDTLTVSGILKNFYGEIEFDAGCTLIKRDAGGNAPIKQETDPLKIVDAAYKLKENTDLGYDVTLTGKVVEVVDAYDSEYKNITVTIQISGREKKPIICYRLKGEGVEKVAKGDTITVTGRLKNYYGDIEFDNGCKMTKRVSGGGEVVKVETDPKKIVDAAFKLKDGEQLAYDATLTGKVTSIKTPYDAEHSNISVIITVEGKSIVCFRMKGTGVDKITVDDTITVKGRLKNYGGTVEFDANCEMTKRVSGGVETQTDFKKIVEEAYALKDGEQLKYTATLTGKVVKLDVPYDESFKNMNLTIAVAGCEDKPILCYRLKGDGLSNNICVGDTITVKGTIKNYKGTIEFDTGCTASNIKSGGVKKPTDPKKIVDAAFALAGGDSLKYFATLTGKVTEINTAYDSSYKNITITIEVEGSDGMKELKCYRLKGEGADKIKVGDTVTVTGVIKNYVHSSSGDSEIEFDAGCVLG
ncbi:MAG: hypothetical protein IJB11_01235 [Oscillospiraceae bacterium]|nr:hypothetical protein [Oscillospiraceae bacterium]